MVDLREEIGLDVADECGAESGDAIEGDELGRSEIVRVESDKVVLDVGAEGGAD